VIKLIFKYILLIKVNQILFSLKNIFVIYSSMIISADMKAYIVLISSVEP